MFKCDLNIKNTNVDSYLEAHNWWKWSKLEKVKMLTFDFEKSEKSNSDRLYIQMWFEFRKINVDSCSKGISQDRQNDKKSKSWLLTWNNQSLTLTWLIK